MKIKKKIFISVLISFLLISLIYISDITNIPDSIILFKEEEIDINTIFGITLNTVEVSSRTIDDIQNGCAIQASSEDQRK